MKSSKQKKSEDFYKLFKPQLTPKKMLELGVFGGSYFGSLIKEDPLGWFQWYCRFSIGRRIPHIDEIQIKRWKNFRRHVIAIKKNCESADIDCRRRQRQAILQWAYNPFV